MGTLNQVLASLKNHAPRSVLVTGPQRSGTTIAAHILAHELAYAYVDEDEVHVHNADEARQVLRQIRVVLQAPGLCSIADRLNALVVIMRRDLAAIAASEKRIGWVAAEANEYCRYGLDPAQGPIAALKYRIFDALQKPFCMAFDLEYESLAEHPLWVPAERRAAFTPRQWAE